MQLLRMAHLNRLAYQRGSSAAGWSGRGGSAEGTSKQHETRSARESSLGTSTGPGTVFMDFDGTLTRDDTCAEFSVMGHPEPGPQRHGNQLLWSRLVREYDEARDAFMARHVPQGRASRFDPGCLKWFLKESSAFERLMMDKVEESGVLEGISLDQLEGHAAECGSSMQPGAAEFMHRLHRARYGVVVCSTNWSRRFILGILAKGFHKVGRTPGEYVTVCSNELVMDPASQRCVGRTDRANVSADSKALRVRLHKMGEAGWSCYVGNAADDIAPMLQCNLGVFLGPMCAELLRVVDAFGIQVLPLEASALQHGGVHSLLPPTQGTLYAAADWPELSRALLHRNIEHTAEPEPEPTLRWVSIKKRGDLR